jgi:hypothetical protein
MIADRRANAVLAFVCFGALACTIVLSLFDADPFRRFFGDADAIAVVAAVAIAGAAALLFLRSRGWFDVVAGRATWRGVAASAGLASVLAPVAIAADLTIGFPRDINVPAPWSLLFYPAIALVAETVFHLLPLALLAGASNLRRHDAGKPSLLQIAPVALLEPVFQIYGGLAQFALTTADAFVFVHVLIINLLQLAVFRRYDFVSMLALRLIYYAYWHIAWGYLRLEWIF